MIKCDFRTWCGCNYCEDRKYSELLGDIQRWQSKHHLRSNSIVPHESNCDIWECKKDNCFLPEPDKIVSAPYSAEIYKYITPVINSEDCGCLDCK